MDEPGNDGGALSERAADPGGSGAAAARRTSSAGDSPKSKTKRASLTGARFASAIVRVERTPDPATPFVLENARLVHVRLPDDPAGTMEHGRDTIFAVKYRD
jgi:hypothetical protein